MSLIILDRDGVINRDLGTYVTRPDDFQFVEGAVESIADLKQAGHTIAIATNQAGIARGCYSHEVLAAIHAKMLMSVRKGGGDIDRIVYCDSYDNEHPWRKPNPGMLNALLDGFNTPAEQSVFIGDAIRDMQAGHSAGCRLIMVTHASGRQDYNDLPKTLQAQVLLTDNLRSAATHIINQASY